MSVAPIGIKITLDGQREVSDGLKRVGQDVSNLGNAGQQLGGLSQGMGKAALTAGQLQQATQQLPMQFQDIVVSLQAGQQPLTVLLQQGSQLAGSFGGAGAAAKAMLGYIVGLVNPVTVLAGSVAALGVAYYQGSKEQDAWIRGIVTTGNASGVTVGQLRDYARAIDGIVGTQRDAAMGLNDFVQAGVRGGEELRRYTEAALLWERATGQAVNTTAKQFADLQKAPLQSVLKLNEGTNFLTVSVYEQIQALEEQGNKTEAARVAMDALEGSMRERAQQIEESLGYIEKGWKWVTEAADEAWDAMLGVGRKKTNRDLLRETQAELDVRLSRSDVLGNDEHLERGNAKLRARIAHLQDLVAQEDLNAASQAESARLMRARESFDSKYSKALEGEVALQQKLAVARKEAEAAGKSEADIKKVLAYVTEEHNKSLNKGGSSAKTAQTGYQNLLSTINQKIVAMQTEAKTGEKLTETEKLRARYQEELNTKGRQYTAQHRERIEAGLALLEQQEKQKIAAQELVKANEEDARTLERLTQQRERSAEALEQSVKAAREEEQAAALAAASNITHAEAVAQLAQARAEDAYMQAVANGEAPKTLEFLEREMQARRQLTQLMGQRVVREANKKAADDAAKAWDKVIDGVGDGFYTAIVSDGASALQALQRVAEATILRPMVQYGANNIAGAMGLGSEGSASSLSTAASMVKNGHSIYGALTGSLTYGLGSAAASIGAAIGSTAATSFGAGMAASGFTASAFSTGASMVGAGATSTGLGMMAGAALPWVAGGLAVYSIAKSLFGSSNPHDHRGGVYSNATSDRNTVLKGLGLTSGPERSDFTSRENAAVSTALGTTIDELLGAYDTLAERATGAARDLSVYAGFATNPKDKGQNAYGYLRIFDAATQDLIYKATHRNSSDALGSDPAQAFSNFTGEIAGVLVQQLKAADLPGWMRTVFDGMGETVTLESFSAAMQQIQAIDYQIDMLGKTMTMFVGISDSMKTSLLGGLGGMEGLTATAQGFYQSYYSEQERYEASLKQMRDVLASLEIGIDPAMGERAKADFKAAVLGAFEAGNGELSTQLLAINQAFDQVASYAAKSAQAAADAAREAANAAVDRAQSVADAAMRQLEASIDREKSYWQSIATASQTAISSLTSTLGLLTSNARDLYGTVDSAQQMMAAQGMVYVENALAAVKRGASVLDFAWLSDAISAARGGISNGAYATQFDKDRDALVLAGQMSELGDLADLQLSVEERALKAAQTQIDQLDQTLQYWQEALSYDQLQIDATMSVASAVYGLDSAIRALASAQAAARAAEAASSWSSAIVAATPGSVSGKVGLYQQMAGSGMSDSDIRNAVYQSTGNYQTQSDWDLLKKLAGVPGYASGGSHAGGLRVVGERGWELEATGPARIWNQSQLANALSGGGNAELVAEVRALRAEVAALRAANERTASNTSGLPQMVDQIDQVTEGGNAMRAEVV